MTTLDHILNEATRIVGAELGNHLGDKFVVSEIRAETLPGPDDEDYIHVNVIFEDGHPELDPRKILEFKQAVRPLFARAGVEPLPAISYSDRSERSS